MTELREIAALCYDADRALAMLAGVGSSAEAEVVMRSALAWLLTPQPENAIVSHHGIYAQRWFVFHEEPMSIQLAPHVVVGDIEGLWGKPPSYSAVFIFHLGLAYDHREPTMSPKIERRMPAEDWRAIQSCVRSVIGVTDQWNGAGCDTGSVRVPSVAGPGVQLALANYRGAVNCGPACRRQFCGCDVRQQGYSSLVVPEGWR